MYDIFLRRGRTQSQALSLPGPFVSADCLCVPGDRVLCVCITGVKYPEKHMLYKENIARGRKNQFWPHRRHFCSIFIWNSASFRVNMNHFGIICLFWFIYTLFRRPSLRLSFVLWLSAFLAGYVLLETLELFVSRVQISHEALQAEHWQQMGFSCRSCSHVTTSMQSIVISTSTS